MPLVHIISLPIIIIMIFGGRKVCWHIIQKPERLFPFMCRLIASLPLQLCQCPPHPNLLIILNRRFHSAVKDMIGISQGALRRWKKLCAQQTTLIHNKAIIYCNSLAPHYRCVFFSFFLSFFTLSDVFLKKTIINSLRWRRQLQPCSHGNLLGGNNFAFIKFKVGFDCHWGKIGPQQGADISLDHFGVCSA